MIENFKVEKVGIWGFGAVGQSALSYFSDTNCQITVTDKNELNGAQMALIEGHKAQFVPYDLLPQFLEMNDTIIPSPGVDLKPYLKDIEKKLLPELDLFAECLEKPTIAITGSVGKTTVTHILTHLLNKLGKKALAAGNIGFPLLDALAVQHEYDILVLELSSFQLQHHELFEPDLAIITNFYPNHLDQHADIEEYLTAKGQLLKNQNSDQKAIIPMDLVETFWQFLGKQNVEFPRHLDNDITKKLSDITCPQNWRLIVAALEHFKFPTDNLEQLCADLPPLKNRVECIGTFQGVTFYNDSKATIPEATLSAVEKFKNDRPFLFLGGLGKGVDRTELIKQLKNKVKHVICFGAEADILHQTCLLLNIPSSKHATLEDAVDYCNKKTRPGDVVLFSPAGSSFDLFKNYVERGKRFSDLVQQGT